MILNATAELIEQDGNKKTLEISTKRRFTKRGDVYIPIDCTPRDAVFHAGYKFEILDHDLKLGFAPSERGLPFLRIMFDNGEMVGLWLQGLGSDRPRKGIKPLLVERTENGVLWQLDNVSTMRLDILGHMIRKEIVLEQCPEWNLLTFRIFKTSGLSFVKTQTELGIYQGETRLLGFHLPIAWQNQAPVNSVELSPADYIPTPVELTSKFQQVNNNIIDWTIRLDPDWLDNAKYPVIIDPTIVLQPGPEEGYDAFYYCDYADRNAGAYNALTIYNYVNPVPYGRGFFIKFNLSAIPNGANIVSSKLHLYNLEGAGVGLYIPIQFNCLLRDWGEGNKIFQPATDGECSAQWWRKPNQWSSLGANTIGEDIAERVDPIQNMDCLNILGHEQIFDVTETIKACFNADHNYGFRTAAASYSGTNMWVFVCSSDYSTAAYRPKLVVEYEEPNNVFIPARLGALAGKGVINPLASGG